MVHCEGFGLDAEPHGLNIMGRVAGAFDSEFTTKMGSENQMDAGNGFYTLILV